jgi:hypothetical protein
MMSIFNGKFTQEDDEQEEKAAMDIDRKELIEQLANKPVDAEYFCKKLNLVIRDIRSYTSEELSLELNRLANTAYQAAAPIDNVAEALEKAAKLIEGMPQSPWGNISYTGSFIASQVRALIPTQANRTEG